ncbi:MAG: ribbon-helix-helix protein, CopG family [Alphaproteobacteria bacterium]|nr:ribbon-helix-helix protein, CopG family [Rhodospirillales bacterium]MCW9046266.1 ribbon-helix-helix protein, CopG family [Alphaproteobacteria bacterium]
MATSRNRILVSFTQEERVRVDKLAAQLRLSRSELMRRLVLGYHIPKADDFVAWEGIRDLLKVNADLARLGNLFKLAIEEAADEELANTLKLKAEDLTETQAALKASVFHIRDLVQPRKA